MIPTDPSVVDVSKGSRAAYPQRTASTISPRKMIQTALRSRVREGPKLSDIPRNNRSGKGRMVELGPGSRKGNSAKRVGVKVPVNTGGGVDDECHAVL